MTAWRLHPSDCLSGLVSLDSESVDHVMTDPPYDAWTHKRGGSAVRRYDGGPDIAEIPFEPLGDVRPYAEQIARVTRRWALVFCAVRQIESWCTALEAADFKIVRICAWVKPDASPQFSGDRPGHGFEPIVCAHRRGRTRWNGGGKKGVWTVNRMDHESGFHHPTQKPVDLMTALIRDFTDPGELICDPFSGSGTTGVAAIRLGRRFLGWERDEEFFRSACARLEAAREQPELMGLDAFKRAASKKRKQEGFQW